MVSSTHNHLVSIIPESSRTGVGSEQEDLKTIRDGSRLIDMPRDTWSIVN